MTNSNVSVTSANGVSFDLESEELLVDGEVRRLQAKESIWHCRGFQCLMILHRHMRWHIRYELHLDDT